MLRQEFSSLDFRRRPRPIEEPSGSLAGVTSDQTGSPSSFTKNASSSTSPLHHLSRAHLRVVSHLTHPQQDGMPRGGGGLQAGGHLAAVPGGTGAVEGAAVDENRR